MLRPLSILFPRLRWIVAAVVLAGLFSAPLAAQPVNLPGLDGGALRQADLDQGKVVAVVWASWSPRCRDIVERVNGLVDRWGGQARVVTVDFQEERGDIQGFLAGKSLRAPVYLDADGAFSKKYAITSLPGLVVMVNGNAAYAGKLPDDPGRVLGDLLR